MNLDEPPGWRLRRYETLASTSDLCATLAAAGEPDHLAVLAARQTHGRGSRGRTWQTLPGNLALSVLLRPTGPVAQVGQWALLSAVALAEAIEIAAPGTVAQVKWPNDIELAGAKVGGILIDAAVADQGRMAWLVLGFGANLAVAPDLTRPVASVPGAPDPDSVTSILLARLDHWDRVRLLDGFAPIRRVWLGRGPVPGAHMRVRWGNKDLGGTFAGLGDDGALLLQSGGQVHALQTGEILQTLGE
ncbi:MAG: biotin--[acetyl-CoA-carboxylase] ligase [Janthinobacterium lividum]